MERQITSWGYVDWLWSKDLDSAAQADIGVVCLLPRASQAEHTHYSEIQFLYTLEGRGEHIIDGQRRPCAVGDSFLLPCGVTHSTINRGDEPLRELMVSVPVHLPRSAGGEEALARSAAPAEDPAQIQEDLLEGIGRLARDTLDHLRVPIVITGEDQRPLYGGLLSETCGGCGEEDCPIRRGAQELRLQGPESSGSVVCPRGLTVLIQPVSVAGRVRCYIKGGLFHEYPNVPKTGGRVYDVPGSTVNSMGIFMQDIGRCLQDFCREKELERALLRRDGPRELAAELERSRDSALSLRVRNHFLFNSLNSIASLAVRDGSMDTYRAILDLAELLRGLLRREGARVPLAEEMAFLERYVRLQELRCQEGLTVTWRRCSAAERVVVPHNFLQPIVENAFVHGFREMRGQKALTVETREEGGRAVVRIADNGRGMDARTLEALRTSLGGGEVHGLAMVHRKLTGVFGTDFSLRVQSAPGEGTVCRLDFPLGRRGEMSPES